MVQRVSRERNRRGQSSQKALSLSFSASAAAVLLLPVDLGVDLVAVFLRVVPLFPVGRGRVVDEPLVKGSPDSVGSPERMLRASSSTFSIVDRKSVV